MDPPSRIALPSCRNYWRLQEEQPSLQPQLHSSQQKNRQAVLLMHPNPNQKYYKRSNDHSPSGSGLRYRIKEPLSPFRGLARLVFWTLFALILIFIGTLVITVFWVGMSMPPEERVHNYLGKLGNNTSIILRTLFNNVD